MVAAEQVIRLVLVLLILGAPVAAAWTIAYTRRMRHPPADRPRVRRRYLTGGAAVSALLAMGWLSGLFVDAERQAQTRFFAAVLQSCLDDCSAIAADEACTVYCRCHRDRLRSVLPPDTVAAIAAPTAQAGLSAAELAAIREAYQSEIVSASSQCRDHLGLDDAQSVNPAGPN